MVSVMQDNDTLDTKSTSAAYGIVTLSGNCKGYSYSRKGCIISPLVIEASKDRELKGLTYYRSESEN